MSTYIDFSEIVVGRMLAGIESPHIIEPSMVAAPYDRIVSMLQGGKDKSDLLEAGLLSAVQACEMAEAAVNDPDVDYVSLLQRTKLRQENSRVFLNAGKSLERGEEIDVGKIIYAIENMDNGDVGIIPLSEAVEDKDVFRPTYWQPIDEFVGGIPKANLTTIAGDPGSGKTGLLVKIASKMVKAEPDSKVLIFSAEMTTAQILKRLLEIEDPGKDNLSRILVSDAVVDVDDIYTKASQLCAMNNIGMIGVDFADLIIKGTVDESAMAHVYKTLANLGKNTGVPVILLAQFNRGTHLNPEPRVNDIRYSAMAEIASALILLIHNPNSVITGRPSSEWLPKVDAKGYVLVGKSRYGTELGGLGAVQVDWDGKAAWGNKGMWFKP